jgi:hypothetical protein
MAFLLGIRPGKGKIKYKNGRKKACLKKGAEKMGKNKKLKEKKKGQKNEPAFYNDQLGENPVEGRVEKEYKEKRRK